MLRTVLAGFCLILLATGTSLAEPETVHNTAQAESGVTKVEMKDAIHIQPDGRCVVVVGALDAFLNQQAVSSAEDDESESTPLEVICYELAPQAESLLRNAND